MSSGAQRGEMLASGVTYYPPATPAPPAYSRDVSVIETGSPLLDISIDKILHLVTAEMNRKEPDERMAMRGNTETETDESEDEDDSGSRDLGRTTLSSDFAQLGGSSAGPLSPLARRISKRRRGTLGMRPRPPGSPEEWPFKKELLSIVECDVCAMMLHDPVTTPCQHVSLFYACEEQKKICHVEDC